MNLKLKKVVAAVISLIMITVGSLSFATVSFSDIEGHWAKGVVVEMAEKGVLNGFDDGTFKPDESVTREQFAKILVETLKLTEKTTNIKFVDVEDGRWSKDFIYRASKYLTGYEYNGNYFFRPSDATTREDVAVAVVQAQGLQNEEPDYTLLNQFSDKDEISSGLRKYVAIAVKNEIMRGKGGFFDPQGNLTRAEVSQLMYNVFKKVSIGDVEKPIIYGDVNDDGKVDDYDVIRLQNYLNGKSVKLNEKAADVNLDGKVDIADSFILLKHVAGWSDFSKLPHSCKKQYTTSIKQSDENTHKVVYTCGCGVEIGEITENHSIKDGKCTKCGYEEKVIIYGDVNADGKVDDMDVIRFKKYLNGYDVEIDRKASDVNLDGKVDIVDSFILLKHVSGWSNFSKLPHSCKKQYTTSIKQSDENTHKIVYTCGCGVEIGETTENHSIKDGKCTKCGY